jgi:hypothetical protein
MNKTLFNTLLLISGGLILRKLLFSKKMIIKGNYTVPKDKKNRLDALHSFESRKSDKFGGYMATKINKALRNLYAKGINPDIYELKIDINPVDYSVNWSATIGPSKNKNAYVGLYTRGSAGAGADERAKAQVINIKQDLPNARNIELIKDLNFTDRVKIRQFFYKYGLNNYPNK